MKNESRFIRVITTDENEVIIALDSILSVEREGSGGIVTMKNNTIYKVRVLNAVLDAIDNIQSQSSQLEEMFGISVKSQPQFLNFVTESSGIVINASTIKKIDPIDDITTEVTLIGDNKPIKIECNIRRVVEVLANVMLIDAGGL